MMAPASASRKENQFSSYDSEEEFFDNIENIMQPCKRRQTNDVAWQAHENNVISSETEDDSDSDIDENLAIKDVTGAGLTTLFNVRWKKSINRKRKKRIGWRMLENTSQNAIQDVFHKVCCNKGCIKKFTVNEITDLRKEFWSKVTTDQTTWMLQQISATHAFKENQDNARFCIDGKFVCVKGWQRIYQISKSRFYRCRNASEKGHRYGNDGRKDMSYYSERLLKASLFLTEYSKKFGEVMPDNENIHLPSCITKKSVYFDYCYDVKNDSRKPISYSHFRKMWRTDFQNVKTSKNKRFSKCKACSAFQEALLMRLTKEELTKLREQKKAHLLLQKICREKYYKHIKKARRMPAKYLSLIIDNMDQSKTRLPRFHDIRKGEENAKTLHHHVTGVLNHGQGRNYVFTWTDRFACDANITINCLLNVFGDVAKDNDGRLPEVLYLQADNSAKDNKNVILMGFIAGLVQRKIFRKVKLSFLMVGHTHEDVDQMFSSISKRLNKHSVPTLYELHKQIKLAHTPMPAVTQLHDIWDYRRSIINHSEKLVGHQSPHVFTFSESDGKVYMRYKDWPLRSEIYKVLDVSSLSKSVLPRKPPVVSGLTAKFVGELDGMEAGLGRWNIQGRLLAGNVIWWQKYLKDLRKPAQQPEIPVLEDFLVYHLHAQQTRNVPNELVDIIDQHVRKTKKKSEVRLVKA